jgi:hypothetical protein
MLGALRLSGREEILLVRTQSPRVMTSFLRLCDDHGYRPYTPLSPSVPDAVRAVLAGRFSHEGLVHRAA